MNLSRVLRDLDQIAVRIADTNRANRPSCTTLRHRAKFDRYFAFPEGNSDKPGVV